jgi:fumarate reductase subunit D
MITPYVKNGVLEFSGSRVLEFQVKDFNLIKEVNHELENSRTHEPKNAVMFYGYSTMIW